ncbi:serine/threonine protein kinase [Actinomadura rudentiformis]|uniref:non-specific serine/threonine protein kinase n=2 Tax=Actinomadura rudentiformis TaxID=359158 RepID=A0A6H9YNX8_9ACTN|nr:serine/threonine protein kinase [Actinomadura rudentiformis]
MGTVWRARDLALHREVALKEVRPTGSDPAREDPELARKMRERVLREARALARIDHPNVVRIHHIIDEPDMDYPWLVMELVRGGSLSGRLAEGDLSPAEAAVIGRGVLGALRAAHEAGICHRDVKPANVLLRTDGSPVLTDFGIAAIDEASRLTMTGGLAGSPEYIAPERLHGEEGNPASDLWSLGMLLYVAVEGHSPMRRPTTAATLAAVLRAQVPPPVRAGALTGVLRAVLVPDPAARPTAEQLDRMLAEAAVGRGTTTPEPFAFPPPPAPAPPAEPQFPHGRPTGPGLAQPTGQGLGHSTGPGFPPRRSSRRLNVVLIALPISAIALAGVLLLAVFVVFTNLFDGERQGSGAGEGDTDRSGVPKPVVTVNLLSPAGMRKVIAEFEKVTGSKKFMSLTVYPEYAFAKAPLRANKKLYDEYRYRDGRASRQRAGGTIGSDDGLVDLRTFNWNKVPVLFREAEKTLGVTNPKTRYIIVNPAWTFYGKKPVMMFYLSGPYGGGYLAANQKGTIVHRVKQG